MKSDSYMLDLMFEQALTDAEIKAIARNRHFPVGDTLSRSVVKNFFLTMEGVEEMLASLSVRELALLHHMKEEKDPVDVTFFERLYHESEFNFLNVYSMSFHQRYKDVLKDVRDRLVRKGLLLFWPDYYGGGAKIEQWKFLFPPEFADKLPPLIQPIRLTGPDTLLGEMQDERVRTKILQLTGEAQNDPLVNDPKTQLRLENGTLWWGKQIFTSSGFLQWQMDCWGRSLAIKVLSSEGGNHPVKAVIDAVSSLRGEEWFDPQQLVQVLEVQCFGLVYPSVEKIIDEGWQWGLFARRPMDGRILYSPRLPVQMDGVPIVLPELDQIFHVEGKKAWVDLKTVPQAILSDLNQIGELKIEKKHLYVSVDLVRLTKIYPVMNRSIIGRWLCDHVKAFEDAVSSLQHRWGKTILHENLLVAQIQDVTLRVQIERGFTAGIDYIPLTGEWVAFRKDILPEVEKLVKKADHVVRRVKAGQSGSGAVV